MSKRKSKKEHLLYLIVFLAGLVYFIYIQINNVFIPILFEGKTTMQNMIIGILSLVAIVVVSIIVISLGMNYISEK